MNWGHKMKNDVGREGFWANFSDPSSGLLMDSDRNGKIYSEVESASLNLHFDVIDIGCCKLLCHPKWGTSVYPATFFTDAPLPIIKDLLQRHLF